MSKYRISPVPPVHFAVGEFVVDLRPRLESNHLDLLPVDQFSGQSFMKNENGFIMNDIEAFNNAQSDSIARTILSRCPVFKKDRSEDGLEVTERLDRIIPENCCSPAEFSAISKRIATLEFNKRQAAIDVAMEAQQAALARAESARRNKQVDKIVEPKNE